jgi:hypothetical protein
MAAGRSVLVQASQAGPPCIQCVHYADPHCAHPVHNRVTYSPVDGSLNVSITVPAETARDPEGLCGFEAVMFEPRAGLVHLIRANLSAIKKYLWLAWAWFVSASLFGMILWALLLSP